MENNYNKEFNVCILLAKNNRLIYNELYKLNRFSFYLSLFLITQNYIIIINFLLN